MSEILSKDSAGFAPADGSAVCHHCGRGSVAIAGNRVRSVIVNAHSMMASRYRGRALWGLVSDLTGHGSTESIRLCVAVELDPHQKCGGVLHPPNAKVSDARNERSSPLPG